MLNTVVLSLTGAITPSFLLLRVFTTYAIGCGVVKYSFSIKSILTAKELRWVCGVSLKASHHPTSQLSILW